LGDGTTRRGQVLEVDGEKAVVQVRAFTIHNHRLHLPLIFELIKISVFIFNLTITIMF
jgi:hypothetical protein